MTYILKSEDNTLSRDGVLRQYSGLLYPCSLIIVSLLVRFFCIGSHDLFVEEAYYWNYSQYPDLSYLDHPPMVALLIKLSTLFFGTTEFGIQLPALFCWGLAAFFSFKLTELIYRGSGIYALLLLSILPYYFLQSLIITPDQPVLVCWSAALYYFYRIFIFEETQSWYKAGIWLGLGLLSKYTIVLLGPAVLFYMILVPSARVWFIRKEPYLCALIAALFFAPVIYWNVEHEWISFIFQSTRRFKHANSFSFHHFIGLVLLFLLPGGVLGLYYLWNEKWVPVDIKIRRFIQIFTGFPLAFFGVYSVNHPIKLDWIGPGLIALIPWIALLISKRPKFCKAWHHGSAALLPIYAVLIGLITFGASEKASQVLFRKMISWENLTEQLYDVAQKVELTRNTAPIFVPLDVYNIGSELAFYQAKFVEQEKIHKSYSIIGRHIFGLDSLMYRYWSAGTELSGKTLILISPHHEDFDLASIKKQAVVLSSPQKLWSHSQGRGVRVGPYYYEVVQMK